MRLILASASPRRAELLRAAGFEFDTIVVDVDESVRAGESPAAYVRRLAEEKSAAARANRAHSSDNAVVLAADTAVVVDGDILGKPSDDADAARMLRKLAGRGHEVLTGVSLRPSARAIHGARSEQAGVEIGRVVSTAVFFNQLSDADIEWYVASGEGRDKAGAYAIQGRGSRFIARIDGSYSNVVGLPIAAVVELLHELGG